VQENAMNSDPCFWTKLNQEIENILNIGIYADDRLVVFSIIQELNGIFWLPRYSHITYNFTKLKNLNQEQHVASTEAEPWDMVGILTCYFFFLNEIIMI
jgi:hypothetical protein